MVRNEVDVYRGKDQFSMAILSFSDLEMTSQRLARYASCAAQTICRVVGNQRIVIRDISANMSDRLNKKWSSGLVPR